LVAGTIAQRNTKGEKHNLKGKVTGTKTLVPQLEFFWRNWVIHTKGFAPRVQSPCVCCRLKWISGQNYFKLVWFVFPLFYSHSHQTETKENANQTSLKSFWPEIHFNLQHVCRPRRSFRGNVKLWPFKWKLPINTLLLNSRIYGIFCSFSILGHLTEKLKKDSKLLEKIDFHKESCLLSNKNTNLYYC